MTIYEKITHLMCWDVWEGETPDETFVRISNNLNALPAPEIVDIVFAGGLQRWAENLQVENEKQLENRILRAMRKTIAEPVFNNKKTLDVFPPLANFFLYCQRLDRAGKTATEAESIADIVWNQVICKRITKQRADKIFANPCPEKFKAAKAEVQRVYGYSNADIEALRYFVCQIRNPNHDPSKNKSIYHWGKKKQTAKTTVAKYIISIMNGDVLANYHKYSSNVNIELQFGAHDIPKAALYECVLMDEATPKDSRKSYNIIKSKLTDSGCTYNPKYKPAIMLKCKRFYYFTSNDDVAEFIQDEEERRIISIHCEKKPLQLKDEAVYKLWFDFCTNAQPEGNWAEWYDSFAMVKGLASSDIEEIKNEIILKKENVFPFQGKTYTTVKQVADLLFKNEPTRDQKKTVHEVMTTVFGLCRLESNKSYFIISKCREVVMTMAEAMTTSDDEIYEEADNMPF